MSAIFYLLTNIFMTGTSIIGCATIINKIGKFCKVIDENKKDGFKIGFDTVMLESINDINNCVESISTISNNSTKIACILYDILVGNKYIKKDKDGKVIICSKLKVYSGFKDKINELNTKVKKYQEELSKLKTNKETKETKENNDLKNDESSDNSSNSDYSEVSSDDESDYESKKDNDKNKNNNDEFYLESEK